ncbi:indolethylamine N-methyltransferase-like [Glandiceps talaboti]
MTSTNGTLRGDEYHQNFDANTYLEQYYSNPDGNPEEAGLLRFWLQSLHEIFAKDGVSGDRLIDIGSGPCIHHLVSACTKFNEVICCEYVEDNRNAIKRWLNNDVGAFNWKPIIKYVCELEGHSNVEDRETRLRSTIKDVVPCDVNKTNPTEPHEFSSQFDCLLTCLTIEAACLTEDQWKQAVKNIATYIKPGGTIIQICEPVKFYSVGEKKFAGANVDEKFVELALREAGFVDVKSRIQKRAVNVNDLKGIEYEFSSVLTATKK